MFSLSRVLTLAFGVGVLIPFVYTQSNFPPVAVWEIGQFSVSPSLDTPTRFCNFTGGRYAVYQRSGDTAILNPVGEDLWVASIDDGGNTINFPTVLCPRDGPCLLTFGLDGNLVSTFDGEVLWSTGTEGEGMWFVCQESAPWLYIVDGAGIVIWSTSST